MASIAFVPWPELGHILPLLKLARRLRERGHRVVILGLPDFARVVASRGMGAMIDFVPVGQDSFPEGSLTSPNPIHGIVDHAASYRRFLSVLRRPGFFDGVDLLIADSLLPMVAIAAHAARVRVATLHINLPYTREDGLPPLSTPLLPSRGAADRLFSELAWQKALLRRRLEERVGATFLGWPDERRLLAEHAAQCGYPPGDIDVEASIGYRLSFPEFILCPEEFDLPHPSRPNRHYIEPSIETARPEPAFPWDRLDPNKRLLVCTLGSQGHRYRPQAHVRQLFRGVVQAVRDRPGWQLALGSGEIDPASLGPLPPSAIVMPEVPQLNLMKQASAMITHGGISSIKEALYFGVPLIVFPLRIDQPGNAARVAYHGLGVRGDIRRASPAAVDASIRALEGDPAIRLRVEAMSRRFVERESSGKGVEMLAGLAEGVVDYRLVPPRRQK